MIYGSESYKETGEELNETTMEENNEIFEMVFFNKPKFNESFSTQASFSKDKSKEKDKNSLNIYEFHLGKKMGAGKFGEVFVARYFFW